MRGARRAIAGFVLGSMVIWPHVTSAVGTPTQIEDIRAAGGSDPTWLTNLGRITIFSATDDTPGPSSGGATARPLERPSSRTSIPART